MTKKLQKNGERPVGVVGTVIEPLPNEATPEQAAAEAKVKAKAAADLRAEAEAKAKAAADLRAEVTAAKAILAAFKETDQYKAIPEDVRAAIERITKKAAVSGNGKETVATLIEKLFPTVGAILDEFELFKSTKMGRAEMKKKVHYAMSKCTDESKKMWIRFDEKEGEGSWVYDAQQADRPSNWQDSDMPRTRKASTPVTPE